MLDKEQQQMKKKLFFNILRTPSQPNNKETYSTISQHNVPIRNVLRLTERIPINAIFLVNAKNTITALELFYYEVVP